MLTWLNLKNVMLREERTEKQKGAYCVISYIEFWTRQNYRDKVLEVGIDCWEALGNLGDDRRFWNVIILIIGWLYMLFIKQSSVNCILKNGKFLLYTIYISSELYNKHAICKQASDIPSENSHMPSFFFLMW